MDMTTFFAYARRAPFGGRLSQSQIDGMNAIFRQWAFYKLIDRNELAYVLATVFHETGGRMVPVRETFASSDNAAINSLEKAWKAGRLPTVKTPYWRKDKDGKSWFGRGAVQITHQRNYKTLGDRLDVDVVGNPSLALDLDISAKIVIVGMLEGLFTGKQLPSYFKAGFADPVGARAVVNGNDKAKLIAGYYKNFLDALDAAQASKAKRPDDVSPDAAKADDVPPSKSKALMALVSGAGGSAGISLITGISNPWAFGSFVLLVIVLALGGWLIGTGKVTFNRGGAS